MCCPIWLTVPPPRPTVRSSSVPATASASWSPRSTRRWSGSRAPPPPPHRHAVDRGAGASRAARAGLPRRL